MSASIATRPRSANSTQLKRLSAVYSLSILQTIGIAVAIGLAVSGVLWVVLRIFGVDTGNVEIMDPDRPQVMIASFAISWFGIPLAAAAIAAFVHSIVIGAGHTRVPIANGATRTNVTLATLAASVVGGVVIIVLTLLTYLGEKLLGIAAPDSMFGGLRTIDVAGGMLAIFFILVAGLAIGAVFIRYHWLVGVTALVTANWILPLLAERFNWGWYSWLVEFGLIQSMILLALAAGAYAFLLRKLQVP